MNNQLTIFDFGDQPVRLTLREDEPWFVAPDICRVLEHSNARMMIVDLDDDEKADVSISYASSNGVEQRRTVNIISESGLYALIFKSRKAQARKFRKWVTSVVLPSIRKTGRYEAEVALQQTERGRLARLRELLVITGEEVRTKKLSPGQAQAIAITAQRYLESIKVEGEALGYEKVFGLQDGETANGILPKRKGSASQLLQDVPQRPLPPETADEPELPSEASRPEGTLAEGESTAGTGSREGVEAQGQDGVWTDIPSSTD
jgi:prophage antirepressor-like protein